MSKFFESFEELEEAARNLAFSNGFTRKEYLPGFIFSIYPFVFLCNWEKKGYYGPIQFVLSTVKKKEMTLTNWHNNKVVLHLYYSEYLKMADEDEEDEEKLQK